MKTLLFFSLVLVMHASWAEDANPHALQGRVDCSDCHIESVHAEPGFSSKTRLPDSKRFKDDGVGMCIACHPDKSGHMVGVKVDFPIPADLPLDEDNAVNCLTCHYMHGVLHSERPRASYGVIDILLNSDRLRKSYLLRRRNVDGELCRICHDSS